MNSTYIIYKTLMGTYQRLGRDMTDLMVKIRLSHETGRLSDEEYTELMTPEAEVAK